MPAARGPSVGVDCTFFDFERDRFCGAAAGWVSLAGDGHTVTDVHCDAHRSLADRAIAPGTLRAPRSVILRAARFLVPVLAVIAWCVGAGAAPLFADERDVYPRVVRSLSLANLVLHGADLAQTSTCIAAGGCHEANPILAPLARRPFWFGTTKFALVAGVQAMTWQLSKKHPRVALVLLAGEVALEGAVVIHNARVLSTISR